MGNEQLVRLLVEYEGDVNAPFGHTPALDERTLSAFLWACRVGHEHIVRFLLDNGGKSNVL
ncbi:hypothetical protein M427DRAFT_54782 [Gonapodya prolifera JEL478]|uniref:Uncharacterized protein n=1 Tax=Gonapodya prolifera (strain JEL478) TaxID=1344416 RepID=A0A139AK27_GONPJ|nr:hypothetical protein M427DRAFT_54782 [Gonapodya prolifera JEL478]|eukprot:KXS17127.1 hypothetical protein M427DRAFT_54782 [Gonapodya prolifera JEL478]